MATVYEVEITSHWINYSADELKDKIDKLLNDDYGNEYSVDVEKKGNEKVHGISR